MNILNTITQTKSKPFVKWLGGKTKLLPELHGLQPDKFNNYYEPFVGGGAFLFSLNPDKAVINDLNPHLINLYKQVRDNLEELIDELGNLKAIYLSLSHDQRSDFYYKRREEFNMRPDNDVRGAVLFLFLNKTCYNGVHRENASGKFNVPFGKRKTTLLFDEDELKNASDVLKRTVIHNTNFDKALNHAKRGDLVYLDPPYVPLNSTSNFTKYLGSNFGQDEHTILKAVIDDLDKKGCLIMMSNSDTSWVRNMYAKYNQTKVLAERAVNCKALGRGKITELVITNY